MELLPNYSTPEQMISVDSQTLAAVILSEFGGAISKRGSPYLRRAIWLASFVAAFKSPRYSSILRV